MTESNRMADVATAYSADVPRLLEVLGLGHKQVVSLALDFTADKTFTAKAVFQVTEAELRALVEELYEQKPEKQNLLSVTETR